MFLGVANTHGAIGLQESSIGTLTIFRGPLLSQWSLGQGFTLLREQLIEPESTKLSAIGNTTCDHEPQCVHMTAVDQCKVSHYSSWISYFILR